MTPSAAPRRGLLDETRAGAYMKLNDFDIAKQMWDRDQWIAHKFKFIYWLSLALQERVVIEVLCFIAAHANTQEWARSRLNPVESEQLEATLAEVIKESEDNALYASFFLKAFRPEVVRVDKDGRRKVVRADRTGRQRRDG